MPTGAIRVTGFTELHRALKFADKDVRLGIRKAERDAAKPIASAVEELAVRQISHIGVPWSRMRIGITQKLVYVAPRQRGNKARRVRVSQARRRADQKFARRLLTEAMEPGAERNRHVLEKNLEDMLENMADNFNRGG